MRHRGRAVGLHEDRARTTAMRGFLTVRGADAMPERFRAIAALPTVVWKGRTLYTIRCQGDFGQGPHAVNVPESLLWALMSLEGFHCAYHR